MRKRKVILVGDSIRMGYQETVKNTLADLAEVWAPGENGGTSRNVRLHLGEWVISRDPDVVHLNCGLHDLRREPGSGDTFVPLEEYRENIRSILSTLAADTRAAVIFALTTPVDENRHNRRKPFVRLERDVKRFNAAAAEECRRLGVPINDLFRIVEEAGGNRLLQDDGVHFTEEGYRMLGEAVASFIAALPDGRS